MRHFEGDIPPSSNVFELLDLVSVIKELDRLSLEVKYFTRQELWVLLLRAGLSGSDLYEINNFSKFYIFYLSTEFVM